MTDDRSQRVMRAFGVANAIAAVVIAFGVFVALPARWMPIDIGGALVAAILAASGVGILTKKPWADRAARIASFVVLAIGLAFIATLALTASYLTGVYGPVGRGGAIILVLVAALVIPYVVVLPAVQLVWLGPEKKNANDTKDAQPVKAEAPSP